METLRSFLDPLLVMIKEVTGFIPTLFTALAVLVIGIYVSKIVHDVLKRVFKELKFDKLVDTVGLGDVLKKGGVKHSFSELLSSLAYLIVIVAFFLLAVKVIGLMAMADLINRVIAYIPHVISAVVVLVLGMVIANVVGKIMHAAAHATHMPKPKLFERISRWAIVLYAATISLGELGYGYLITGKNFHILYAGIVFAYALAFGLGGKDMAARYLEGRHKK